MISITSQPKAIKPTHVKSKNGMLEVTKWDENNLPIQVKTPADELIDIEVFPRQINEKK